MDSKHFPLDSHRLGAKLATDTQMIWDALTRAPDPPEKEDYSTIPTTCGPWTITEDADGFQWTPTSTPSAKQTLRFHLKPWSTKRAASDSLRIVLIGESAAASWGFKGNYCLSSLLERSLSGFLNRNVEVVDLSLVNAVWDQDCLPAVHAAMTLDPDMFLFFGGNNEARWLLPRLQFSDIEHQHVPEGFSARWSLLDTDPVRRLDKVNAAYTQALSRSFSRIVELINAFGKEILFVIPPFNLGDWVLPEEYPHHLNTVDLHQWCDLLQAIESLIAVHDFSHALPLCEELLHLDGHMCQKSLQIYATILEGLGESDKASLIYSKAIGSGLGAFINGVPSLPRCGQTTLIHYLEAYNIPYIDLPSVFLSDAGLSPPGRKYFLDYCHLSDYGHEILLREICNSLPPSYKVLADANADTSLESFIAPTSHELSLACLMAGLHNYQNAQPEELTKYWLAKAAAHPRVAHILDFFAEVICTSFRERITLSLLESRGLIDAFLNQRFLTFALKFLYHERFDVELWSIINSIRPQKDYLLGAFGDLRARQYNLQSLYYLDCRKGFSQPIRQMSRHDWEFIGQDFIAYSTRASLSFVLDDLDAGYIRSLRLESSPPWHEFIAEVSLFINDQLFAEITISEPHSDHVLDFPVDYLSYGLNTLTFRFARLFAPASIASPDEYQSFLTANGPYPIALLLHKLQFLGA